MNSARLLVALDADDDVLAVVEQVDRPQTGPPQAAGWKELRPEADVRDVLLLLLLMGLDRSEHAAARLLETSSVSAVHHRRSQVLRRRETHVANKDIQRQPDVGVPLDAGDDDVLAPREDGERVARLQTVPEHVKVLPLARRRRRR